MFRLVSKQSCNFVPCFLGQITFVGSGAEVVTSVIKAGQAVDSNRFDPFPIKKICWPIVDVDYEESVHFPMPVLTDERVKDRINLFIFQLIHTKTKVDIFRPVANIHKIRPLANIQMNICQEILGNAAGIYERTFQWKVGKLIIVPLT